MIEKCQTAEEKYNLCFLRSGKGSIVLEAISQEKIFTTPATVFPAVDS
jgi:hypothetical protein